MTTNGPTAPTKTITIRTSSGSLVRIVTARWPGIASDGSAFVAGDRIAWDSRTRKVLAAGSEKLEALERANAPDPHDMAWEDECARRCGPGL